MKEITDLNLMTVLNAKNVDYQDMKNNRGQITLLYKDSQEVNDIIKDYYNNNLNLDARKLLNSMRDMKTLITQFK